MKVRKLASLPVRLTFCISLRCLEYIGVKASKKGASVFLLLLLS